MKDSSFVIFIVFGCIWILMGAIGLVAFLQSEGEEIRFGKWGLVVAIPIIIPLIAALVFAAVHH